MSGIGHDGGGIGIDQHHPVAFLAQRLAGLGAGIVEFAGLADDDGSRADDQDGMDIGAFGHLRLLWSGAQEIRPTDPAVRVQGRRVCAPWAGQIAG